MTLEALRPTARAVAIGALVDVEAGARANALVPKLLGAGGLSERDRAFVTELVYGSVRMRRACDWLVDRHVRRPLDPPVRAALRLGAYQLAFLDTPPHAAVSATVAEIAGPARRLVNAVLRRVAADLATGPRWPDEAVRLSYPDWIVARLSEDLGRQRALAALEQMNQPATMTIRSDGYVQDRASQDVAAAVAAAPAERLVDLCSAPGGKATYLAYGTEGPSGTGSGRAGPDRSRPALVVAADIDPIRAGVVAANARGLSLGNVSTIVADVRRPPLLAACFDRALVDAPCSGLGTLRRRPDARWRVRPADIERLAGLQRELIESALTITRPGGLVVYSVCTMTLAETAGIDRWLASTHPEARAVLLPLDDQWERVGRGARLLPQAAGTDGMFVLAVRMGDG